MSASLRSWALSAFASLCISAPGAIQAAGPAPFNVPADATIPGGPVGDAIKLGRTLITDTRKMLPDNVGNGLNCSNCHLGAGTQEMGLPFVGLWGVYPEYRQRNGHINSMQERVNDCFERSMNGRALVQDSKEMNAILMYIQWLSTGVPVGEEVVGRGFGAVDTALKANSAHGQQVYAEKCANCHGPEGEGTKNPAGGYVFPPVWGDASFNIGAGMARTYTAAAFIKSNMPLGQGGSLSDQDAVDVAEFVTHNPRPPYAAARNDYTSGSKPKDARN